LRRREFPEASRVPDETDEFVLHREMGCTREDFVRWLPGATRNAPSRIDADRVSIHAGGGTVEISFRQAAGREIGLISMPVLNVSFRFLGVGAAACREFMAHFDLYTKRGGG
jgi:hypothetical protein